MDQFDTIKLNSKAYKNVSEKRSIGFHDIEKSLKIVQKFIIDKKRIVYGGLAIDLSLKSVGHPGIYANDSIPDFDIMSPDFYNDSNELAKVLHQAGLKNISSINASHFSSRRVRTNFI